MKDGGGTEWLRERLNPPNPCAHCGRPSDEHPVACFGCQTCMFTCDHYICLKYVAPKEETHVSADQVITVTYINHRGETSVRQIIPRQIRFDSSEWHPGKAQWLMDAFDVGRQADRSFALADMIIKPRTP